MSATRAMMQIDYVDAADVILVGLGKDEKVQFINRSGCEMLGRDESQIVGRNWFDEFLPPEVRPAVRRIFQRLLAGDDAGGRVENAVAAKDGSTRTISWQNRIVRNATGEVVGTVSSGQDVTDIRATESALRTQIDLLRTLVATVPAAVYQTNAQGVYVHCNQAFAQLLGRPLDQIVGRKAADLAPAEPTSLDTESSGVRIRESTICVADGTKRDVVRRESTLRDAFGNLAGVVGVLRDVTLQNRLDRAVRQQVAVDVALAEFVSESAGVTDLRKLDLMALVRARMLTRSTRAWIVSRDVFTGQLVMRRMATEVLEGEQDSLSPPSECAPTGRGFACGSDGVLANDVEDLPPRLASAFGDDAPKRLVCVPLWKDGHQSGCLAVGDADRDYDDLDLATLRRIGALHSLAAERVRATWELRRSEEKFRTLVENLGVGVYRNTADLSGRFVEVNSALCRILGFSDPSSLIGRSVLELYEDSEDRKAFLQDVLSSPKPVRRELRAVRADGRRIWTSVVACASLDSSGRVAWIDGIVEDISDQKRREHELQTESWRDPLTGLFNRRGLITVAEQQRKLARRRKEHWLLMFLDLDGLKPINDVLGHAYGDRALCEVAEALRGTFRDSDILARVGGDEFVAIALAAYPPDADQILQRITSCLQKRAVSAGFQDALGVSVGVVPYDPAREIDLEDAIAEADRRMYAQKRQRSPR